MSAPNTTRELLIAEAIGDLARLLDQAEALKPALLKSTHAFVDARTQLADRLVAFDTHVIALMEQAKVNGVKHILTKTEEAGRVSVDVQTRAMTQAAQALFQQEITPALRGLSTPLQELVQRLDRPWEQWLTHAATGAIASMATAALMTWLRYR